MNRLPKPYSTRLAKPEYCDTTACVCSADDVEAPKNCRRVETSSPLVDVLKEVWVFSAASPTSVAKVVTGTNEPISVSSPLKVLLSKLVKVWKLVISVDGVLVRIAVSVWEVVSSVSVFWHAVQLETHDVYVEVLPWTVSVTTVAYDDGTSSEEFEVNLELVSLLLLEEVSSTGAKEEVKDVDCESLLLDEVGSSVEVEEVSNLESESLLSVAEVSSLEAEEEVKDLEWELSLLAEDVLAVEVVFSNEADDVEEDDRVDTGTNWVISVTSPSCVLVITVYVSDSLLYVETEVTVGIEDVMLVEVIVEVGIEVEVEVEVELLLSTLLVKTVIELMPLNSMLETGSK